MTTMSESGSPSYAGQPPFSTPRALRRSRDDRVISGVSGGLGQYFGVDPVIFRVLFAVLSFFGGVGLLAYGLAWVLIPEPDVDRSLLDKALHELRIRKVPPWLVIIGGAVVVWLGWFSWWAPSTLPAVILIAAVALILTRRLRKRPLSGAGDLPPGWTPLTPPAGAAMSARSYATVPDGPVGPNTARTTEAPAGTPTPLLWPAGEVSPADEPTTGTGENTTVLHGDSALLGDWAPSAGPLPDSTLSDSTLSGEAVPGQDASGSAGFGATAAYPITPGAGTGLGWQPPPAGRSSQQPTAPLIPPLNDTRRSMQAWLAEAGEAHRNRVIRRRPIKVAVLLALLVGWGLVAMFDALFRVPFPLYLWVGLGVFGIGLLVSILARRMTLSLLIPIVLLGAIAIGLGGTKASLSDGSGRIGWLPSSQSQLGTYRQFAGQSTLDLRQLAPLSSPASTTISQAAGEVVLRLPASLNATVIADVHMGDIQDGQSTAAGKYQAGVNVHLQLDPPATATGQPVTIHVSLTTGHVEVDRTS